MVTYVILPNREQVLSHFVKEIISKYELRLNSCSVCCTFDRVKVKVIELLHMFRSLPPATYPLLPNMHLQLLV